MKHPALTRMMGVFMAVVSLVTAIAGGLGFRGAEKDHREQLRQEELLKSRIESAEALLAQMDAAQEEYDEAEALVSGRREAHDRDRSDYRTDLGTYTATRAGVIFGRKQLDDTDEMLRKSMELFQIGLHEFLEAEAAFQEIWELYLRVRGAMDETQAVYDEASAEVPEEDGSVSYSPEEVLALAEAEHDLYGQMGELLRQQQAGLEPDQHQAADLLKQALEAYGEASSDSEGFSVERLVYEAGREIYGRASEAMADESNAEARAEADRIAQENFGMDYDELGDWLDENEPAPGEAGDGESIELSPEILDMLLEAVPNDAALIDAALGLIDDGDQSLSEKEAAFRADPHDMGAAALLLASSGEGLDGAQRVLGLVEPTILETHEQLVAAREQLDAAWYAIYSAQQSVKESYAELDETAAGLEEQRIELEARHEALEADRAELEALERTVETYEQMQSRFRSLRAEMLDSEQIAAGVEAGGGLIEAAGEELERQTSARSEELRTRRILCAVMIAAGLFGFLTALGAFEKPRIRRLWLPLLAAVLLAACGELISVRLGRGLWYSAIFIPVFGVLMFPLTIGNYKGGSV